MIKFIGYKMHLDSSVGNVWKEHSGPQIGKSARRPWNSYKANNEHGFWWIFSEQDRTSTNNQSNHPYHFTGTSLLLPEFLVNFPRVSVSTCLEDLRFHKNRYNHTSQFLAHKEVLNIYAEQFQAFLRCDPNPVKGSVSEIGRWLVSGSGHW